MRTLINSGTLLLSMAKQQISDEQKKEMQEQYVALQILDHQMKQVQELDAVVASLDELASVKAGSEMFVPMSSGIFIKAELKDTTDVLVNVGSGTVVKKSIAQAKALLDGQIVEMRGLQEQLAQQLQKLTAEASNVEEKVSSLMGQLQ